MDTSSNSWAVRVWLQGNRFFFAFNVWSDDICRLIGRGRHRCAVGNSRVGGGENPTLNGGAKLTKRR
jgi:hypothetical protein